MRPHTLAYAPPFVNDACALLAHGDEPVFRHAAKSFDRTLQRTRFCVIHARIVPGSIPQTTLSAARNEPDHRPDPTSGFFN